QVGAPTGAGACRIGDHAVAGEHDAPQRGLGRTAAASDAAAFGDVLQGCYADSSVAAADSGSADAAGWSTAELSPAASSLAAAESGSTADSGSPSAARASGSEASGAGSRETSPSGASLAASTSVSSSSSASSAAASSGSTAGASWPG